jgi:hypothetical protein
LGDLLKTGQMETQNSNGLCRLSIGEFFATNAESGVICGSITFDDPAYIPNNPHNYPSEIWLTNFSPDLIAIGFLGKLPFSNFPFISFLAIH